MKHVLMISLAMITLAACGGSGKKDYDATARCQGLGLQPGTAQYDKCIKEEVAAAMLKQQREEFERMKQDDMDWKLRRY